MAIYDSIDMDWTWDGDYILGKDGDIQDTSDDLIRSFENELMTLVKSETDDWQFAPTFAADLEDFLGEPNTRENARKIEDRIRFTAASAGLVSLDDIDVKVVPISLHEILIVITVAAAATPFNRLSKNEPLVTKIIFDTMENDLFFLADNQNHRE